MSNCPTFYEEDLGCYYYVIVQEPVELAQEFRKFDLAAPWEQFPAFREMIPAAEEVDIDKKKE